MTSGKVTVLQINDVHGYLEPHPEFLLEGGDGRLVTLGGYARISGLFRQVRQECPGAVVALDNGDTFHGTYPVVKTKGEILLPILNHLELDGMTGHWDFAYGPSHFKDLVTKLHHPMLAINCYEEATEDLFFPPTRVIERFGLRIGIIGIAATIVDKTMPPRFHDGIYLTLGRDELPSHIQRLRLEEDVDIIIVLSHLGFPQDIQLAKDVPGIDVLLSGHTHNRMHEPAIVNGAIVIQSGCHGSFVGRLDLEIRDGKILAHNHLLIPVDEAIPVDREMELLVDKTLAPYRDYLGRIVGESDICLARDRMFQTTMDDLLLNAIASAADTILAFSNGWRYGAPIAPGPVTVNDLWNIIPTNPPVSTVELSGSEILTMLEENLERTFAAAPYEQMGGFVKRSRGIDLYLKIENSAGQRIQRAFIEGHPIDLGARYRAAFVTEQGVPKKFGEDRKNLSVSAIEALESYISQGRPSERCGVISVV